MRLNDFIATMENFAPSDKALGFDNVGLLIGTQRKDIRRVLVALDCTLSVANEAVEKSCDMVLTHHPLPFNGIKRILPDGAVTAPIYTLINNGIGLYAAHTNLDAEIQGVNDQLCKCLQIIDFKIVGDEGIMRVGKLENPTMLEDYIRFAEKALCTKFHFSGKNRMIQTVAVMGGSGGGDYELAVKNGADLYITGECKHNQAIEAEHMGLSIAIGGHYETEVVVLKPLIEYLESVTSDMQFIHASSDSPIFRTIN